MDTDVGELYYGKWDGYYLFQVESLRVGGRIKFYRAIDGSVYKCTGEFSYLIEKWETTERIYFSEENAYAVNTLGMSKEVIELYEKLLTV